MTERGTPSMRTGVQGLGPAETRADVVAAIRHHAAR